MAQPATATVTITTTTNAATLASTIAAGNSGITVTGTPTLSVGGSTTSSGTFTATGSNLGIGAGIVLSTGNVTQIPGAAPGPGNISNPGSGISNAGANEFDVATFTFSFIQKPGVNKISIASVFTSEEYNEYVNTQFTDNFSMTVSGGVYSNTSLALVPGTSTGTDINSVNNGTNSGYYRDNTVAPYPIPDIRYDGATKVFYNAFAVVPGTTYTVTVRIADVGDANYDSSAFLQTSTIINNPPAIDLSASAAGTGYSTNWLEGGAAVPIVANDVSILDDGTTLSSATITLNSPTSNDVLSVIGSLPGGITASSYNPSTGVITLSGVATLAEYQTALQEVAYSNTSASPAGPAKTISVVVNDGVDDSNTATSTINIASLTLAKTASAPTVAAGSNASLTDAGDTITYTYVVNNTGSTSLTNVKPVDTGPSFNGNAGTGSLSAFTPATATIAAGGSQTFTATYTLSANDVMYAAGITNGVSNTATATGAASNGTAQSTPSTATTSILTVAGLSLTKSVAAPTIAAGSNATLTDPGDTITYTYVVKNVGSVALTNVVPVDAGPTFNGTAATNALGAFSPTSVASLAAGATTTFTAIYTLSALDISSAVGQSNAVANTATATGKNGAATINSPPSSTTTTITAAPSLSVAKSFVLTDINGGTPGKADVNETITYTYIITNNGNVPMTNVQVKDMHGSPATQVSLGGGGITTESLSNPGPLGASASTNTTPNDGIWDVLAPGASVTFTWPHIVTQAEVDHG